MKREPIQPPPVIPAKAESSFLFLWISRSVFGLFPLEVGYELVPERAAALAETRRLEDGEPHEADRLLECLADRQARAQPASQCARQRAAGAMGVLGVEALGLEMVERS